MKKITPSHWAIGGAVAVSLGLGGALTMAHAAGGVTQASTLVPITPCRLVDTRADQTVGVRNTPVAATEVAAFTVWGTNGNCTIPSTATGIVSNVTVVNGNASSYLTVYPGDAARPLSSNLNWTNASAPTPNQVTVGLSSTGAIKAYNNAGSVDVVIDIVGYYQAEAGGASGQTGQTGQPGPVASKIASGQTVTGYEAFDWDALANSETHDEIIHLPAKAGVDLTDQTVNFANTFSALTPESDPYCTGTYAAPTAPAGRVCLYLDKDSQAGHVNGFALPILKDSGFDVSMTASLGTNFVSMSWAYTAP